MRDMVKFIVADNFFKDNEAQACRWAIEDLQYVDCEYGQTIPNFKLLFDGVEEAFGRVIGEKLTIDKEKSGDFLRPFKHIHFKSFETPNEWCFVIALQRTTFNIYHHLKNYTDSIDEVDARTAFDGFRWNYRNMFEWKVNTNIELEPNQGVFFRPWLFHSLDGGLVQYYQMTGEINTNVDNGVK